MKRKFHIILGSFISILVLGAFTSVDQIPQQQKRLYKNLKVLPKNISSEEMELTMEAFSKALGVKCGYCHTPREDNSKYLDFASDDNPMKDVTRYMMKMTNKINRKHFKKYKVDGDLMQISCQTCHNGNAKPPMRKVM